jgi:hypothetical protein
VPSLFRRKPASPPPEPAAATVSEETAQAVRRPNQTPSKRELGHATPKRREAEVRRVTEPPPTNRREAYRRMRQKDKAERVERRAAMLAGDESALLPRDRGADRALARDVVDSRITIGTWFFGYAIVIFAITLIRSLPPYVIIVAETTWLLLGLGVIVDTYLINRKVNRLLAERSIPSQRGLFLYTFMRGLSWRFLRVPKPRVKVGQKV